MRVENFKLNKGTVVPNQFIINAKDKQYFQSYSTIIALYSKGKLTIDNNALGYSKTTSKYLYQFTGMNRKEIEQGLKDKSIKQQGLNK